VTHPLDPVMWLPIPGTWGFRELPTPADWQHPQSPFSIYLSDRSLFQVKATRGFDWTTDVNGSHFWQRWFGRLGDHRDWIVGGRNLAVWMLSPYDEYPAYVELIDRNIIAHSHALQVVLYACASGLKINKLVSVAGPVRADMQAVAEKARPNIGQWVHVHSDRSDRTQWFGEIGDGVLRIARQHPLANQNVPLPMVGHSKILTDPTAFHWWEDAGLVSFLRTP
jgi:hypothetical protein